jgi:hypothetical protein
MFCLLLCDIRQGKGIRRGAGEREEVWEEEEGRGLTDGVVIDEGRRRKFQIPTRNFAAFTAARAEKQKGRRRGG